MARGWADDDTLSDIVFRGLRDPTSLTPSEMFRFNSSIFGAMKVWEASYHYSLEGGVHNWGSEGLQANMASFVALPGMQYYWSQRRSWYSRDFQLEVDKTIEDGAPRMDEAYFSDATTD